MDRVEPDPPRGSSVASAAGEGGARTARLAAQLPLKTAVLLGLTAGICVPYFLLQRVVLFPTRSAPETPLDAWIGFDPAWAYPYASIALLVPLLPLLATRREDLLRYARGLAALCLACFLVFLLFPVEGPRPTAVPDTGLYRRLISLDRSLNSLPSLHAGLAVYSLLFGYRVLRSALRPGERMATLVVAVVWGGTILYSTLATKQHWVVDLPGGMLIAWMAHRWAWRGAER